VRRTETETEEEVEEAEEAATEVKEEDKEEEQVGEEKSDKRRLFSVPLMAGIGHTCQRTAETNTRDTGTRRQQKRES
jgi:hypothetical protein